MLSKSVLESLLCSSILCPGGSIDGALCSHSEEAEVEGKGPVENAIRRKSRVIFFEDMFSFAW